MQDIILLMENDGHMARRLRPELQGRFVSSFSLACLHGMAQKVEAMTLRV